MTENAKYDNADFRTDHEDDYETYRGEETYPDGSLKCECWQDRMHGSIKRQSGELEKRDRI